MKKDDSGKKLINNSSYLMLDYAAATVLSLVFWMVTSRLFPTGVYGTVIATVQFALLISAFSLVGVNAVVANQIPRFVAENKMGKVAGLIRFSMRFVLSISIAGAAAVGLLSPWLSGVLNLPIEAVWMAAVMIFAWGFWLLSNGIFQGIQNMKLYFKSSFVGQVVKVALPVVFFFVGIGFLGPIIAFTISMLATILIRLPFLPTQKPEKTNGKEVITKLGVPILVSSVMWLIFTNLPSVIINSVQTPELTGIFGTALFVVTPLVFIPMTLGQALFPVTSGLSVGTNKKKQSELISVVVKFAAFITIPLLALLFAFSDDIILLFSGKADQILAVDVLPLVAPAAALLGIGQILVSSVYAIGKMAATRNITVATTTIFVGLSIPATYMFSIFGMGAVYLGAMVFLVLTSYFYLRKEVKLKLEWKAIGKIFLAALVMSVVILPASTLLQSNLLKIVVILVGGLAYLFVLIPMRYYSKDEVKLVSYLISRSSKIKKVLGPLEGTLKKYSS